MVIRINAISYNHEYEELWQRIKNCGISKMVANSQQGWSDITELRLGIWGDIKTAKTSLALSFPKPLVHFDLDQSLIRAAHRYATKFSIEQLSLYMPLITWMEAHGGQPPPDIISIPYQIPIKWPGTKVHGMIAMWDAFVNDVMTAYSTPWVRSVSMDTGTMVWSVATTAHLERVQITNPDRQNLIQIEYSRPNTELRGLYGGATTYHKNLCITHHVGGLYQDQLTSKGVEQMRVGDTWDGFSKMGTLVDLVGRTYITKQNPMMAGGKPLIIPALRVDTCGLTLSLEGQEVLNPTYDTLLAEINSLRAQGL